MDSFLGVPIKTDDSMLDNKVKFVQHDGKEVILDLKTGNTVIDLVATDSNPINGHSEPPKGEVQR